MSQTRIHREGHVGRDHEFVDALRERRRKTLTAEFGRRGQADPAAVGQLLECLLEAGRRGDAGIIMALAAFEIADAVQRLQHLLAEFSRLIEDRLAHIGRGIAEAGKIVIPVDLKHVVEEEVHVFNGGFIDRHGVLSIGLKVILQ